MTHLVGFATGVALYAMLLWLTLAHRRSAKGAEVLAMVTGVLGLVWNLGALASYILEHVEQQHRVVELIAAVSYSALGFLPAAVVHSALRSDGSGRPRMKRFLVGAAYTMSVTGALLQLSGALFGATFSRSGLRILTIAFVALIVPLVALTWRRFRLERTGWIASLAIFAISGFHLSERHIGEYSWGLELLGHHASLPLAFAILFFDYRFAFADLFLKRALTLVVMVTLVSVAFAAVPAVIGRSDLGDPATLSTLVAIAALAMLLYPAVRAKVFAFIDRVVLERADYATVLSDTARAVAAAETPELALENAGRLLRDALDASSVRWETAGHAAGSLERAGTGWLVPVATTEPPHYVLHVGALTRGRRLLSDDMTLLEGASQLVARRIDALRLMRERIAQGAREQELSKLTMEAELRALRAQIQPHFLFNALNTIGSLILSAPEKAFATLLQLTSLLRGVLRSSGPMATLDEEIRLVESYLEVERARFEERLRVAVDIPPSLRPARIPTLILQPLVENAIKHGISQQKQGGEIAIDARRFDVPSPRLVLRVRDDGAGATDHAFRRGRREGVGLANVEERLRVHYGDDAALAIDTAPGRGTCVTVT
ncbi:MAG TPA: histidine kinase, partial [Thermoanaerobaculia bacterium]|nr:histidine kinase [Thermoanaerobaculia bacterium]